MDIDFAIQMDVDFIAVSFVKTADVINNLKSYLTSRCDKVIEIVAKIESHDSVPNAQDIIEASDAVMIARGDLGNALPRTALPCPAPPCPALPCPATLSYILSPDLSCPMLAAFAAIQAAAMHTPISCATARCEHCTDIRFPCMCTAKRVCAFPCVLARCFLAQMNIPC